MPQLDRSGGGAKLGLIAIEVGVYGPRHPEFQAAAVIGHDDMTAAAFDAVTLRQVQALRVMSVDESVGWNISIGVQGLATDARTSRAR